MINDAILMGLAGVLATASPVIFAVIGETISERAGVINLSLNGAILLSAMGGFAAAVYFNSTIAGLLAGMLIGALIGLIISISSITLFQSQVAVGFVLALTCRDLSYFLGNPLMSVTGPTMKVVPIPLLSQIPILGELFFRHDLMTYASFILIIFSWFYIFKTRPGLMLQGIGERPAAAYVRGADVIRLRYIYTIIGAALVGLAGPMYSLNIKAGWKGTLSGLDGIGWIALAITIFGGWNPLRAAFGAYLFALLQWLGLVLQPSLPNIPSQLLQVAPFPLMILTLLLVNFGNTEWFARLMAVLPPRPRVIIGNILRSLRAAPPAALGVPFKKE